MVVTDVCANNLKESLKDGAGSFHRQPAKEKIAGLPPERANQQLGRWVGGGNRGKYHEVTSILRHH